MPQLFGHAMNVLRDFSYIARKHLPKRTSYILRHFEDLSFGSSLINSEKLHTVRRTVIFVTIFLTEENTLFSA